MIGKLIEGREPEGGIIGEFRLMTALLQERSMTKGQTEAKISEAVTRFENDYMGRGPKQIKTTIVQDMIIIRLIGFLSPSEQSLANDLHPP